MFFSSNIFYEFNKALPLSWFVKKDRFFETDVTHFLSFGGLQLYISEVMPITYFFSMTVKIRYIRIRIESAHTGSNLNYCALLQPSISRLELTWVRSTRILIIWKLHNDYSFRSSWPPSFSSALASIQRKASGVRPMSGTSSWHYIYAIPKQRGRGSARRPFSIIHQGSYFWQFRPNVVILVMPPSWENPLKLNTQNFGPF